VFGVVIETVATTPGEGGRIVVRCSDDSIIDEHFKTALDLTGIVGRGPERHPLSAAGRRPAGRAAVLEPAAGLVPATC
jgi:hypothetical protein